MDKKLENFYRQDDHFKQCLDELFTTWVVATDEHTPLERRQQMFVFYWAVNELLSEGWNG